MKGHIERATLEHAAMMAPHMRAGDVEEMKALWDGTQETGLRYCIQSSLEAWAWIVDGQVACLFGIGCGPNTMLGSVGYPWLMSTPLVAKHKFSFLRCYRPYLKRMQQMYPFLLNWCDARYESSLRWLEWMGFKVGEPEPFGPLGLPFRRFWMGEP